MARVRCPRLTCGSHDCTPIATKKGFKTGKGIIAGGIGAIALGPVGAIAGAASGLNGKKKVQMMCNKCGNVFTIKV